MTFNDWLPLLFAGLMGLAILIYALLDGYDLGVGMLLPLGDGPQRDRMIATIGPFWDANETWLVLAVGLLLIAFPAAHGMILGQLYLPVLVLLVGLILRGVGFDFRTKVPAHRQYLWDSLLCVGSVLASLSQGYMLGLYVMGFERGIWSQVFAVLSAAGVTAAYVFIGSSWLLMKTSGLLQQHTALWAQRSLWVMLLGIVSVSVVNPLVSDAVYRKWFSLPEAIVLLPIPLVCVVLMFGLHRFLQHFIRSGRSGGFDWLPFAGAVLIFILCFQGLAYSFYPYVVPFELTVWDAAAATESLTFVLWAVALVLPVIVVYTIASYRVFWGKAEPLRYV